jgi:hypothetical protein
MKKSRLIVVIIILVTCSFINPVKAQWTDMVWESNGIGFKMPKGFTISINDESTFTASGAIFTMSINASEDDENSDPVDICQAVFNNTNGTDKKIITEAAIDDQNGLEGYEAYCTTRQDGKLMHMIIGGYIDPILLTSFTVQLLYWDDPDQNELNYQAAIYILRSLKVTD